MTRLVFCLFGLVFLLFSQATYSQKNNRFISVADIHFDPFIGCETAPHPCSLLSKLQQSRYQDWEKIFEAYRQPISEYYQDTNYPLLKSTLAELNLVNEQDHPQFVFILGDFLAHHFRQKYRKYSGDRSIESYQAFVKKTLQ